MSIGALVSEERSHYKPTPDESSVCVRPVHEARSKVGIKFIPKPTYHLPLAYTLLLRDQQEPPSKLIYVQASANPTIGTFAFNASPQDLLDGISQAILSPTRSHTVHSPACSLGAAFVLLAADTRSQSYRHIDQSLFINHFGYLFHQLLQLAGVTEFCILHQRGGMNCALELAKHLDIRIVICSFY